MSSFKRLKDTGPTSILEVDRQIFTQDDKLPNNFNKNLHAPLIDLKTSLPPYNTRVRHRASVLLTRLSPPPTEPHPWRLVYYADYLRLLGVDTFHRLQAIRNTPGDLLVKHLLTHGSKLTDTILPDETRSQLTKFFGVSSTTTTTPKNRSGTEKIEHIAFHPSTMVLAVSTTFARVHLFDLRTGTFLDYYLCSADDPEYVVVTSLTFNARNELAVGMDNGCVDVWTLNLATLETETPRTLFTPVRQERVPAFFCGVGSPGARELLVKEKAGVERVQLVVGQSRIVGEVTVMAYSPGGGHLAVGTSLGGVWVYSVVLETAVRVHSGVTKEGAKCTALAWGVPPGVKAVRLRGGEGKGRYQLETGSTALMVGMQSGLVVYLRVRENGVSSISVDSVPIEFWPSKIAPGAPLEKGIGQVLLVPSPPNAADQFPTLVVSMIDSPGIHIFRLIPESVLKATVPSASSIPFTAVQRGTMQYERLKYYSRNLYKGALRMVGKVLGDYRDTLDEIRTVHIRSVDTSYIPFPATISPPEEDVVELDRNGNEIPSRPSKVSGGYGGVVKSMAIDPTSRRLVASFSHTVKGGKSQESVVWFDVSGITASTPVLRAMGVIRRVMARDGDEGVGEVGFAGGCERGVCAGVVVGGGKGVGIFPGFIGRVSGG